MKKFEIPSTYTSSIIQEIKEERKNSDRLKKDFSPTIIEKEKVTFLLPRHFGFCYGVENAVEKIYQTIQQNLTKKIYLLSQMIHNPIVNDDLLSQGVSFIMDTYGNQLLDWNNITKDDIVVIPAFGTTIEIEKLLKSKEIPYQQYDTTCPFVEKVWKRSEKLASESYTIIIHGKAAHEETRATLSHSQQNGKAIVVKDIEEAKILGNLILNNASQEEFNNAFGKNTFLTLQIEKDFNRIGVVNQTTMLASETHEIAEYFKSIMMQKYGEENIKDHFADTRDTLCYATNDNQNATLALLEEQADVAVVVGGYNSSNTTHLAELLETKFKTFFISDKTNIIDLNTIKHFNFHTKKEEIAPFITYNNENTSKRIIVTCGASCPDSVLEGVIEKIDTLISTQ